MKENGTSSKLLDNLGKTAGEAGIAFAGALGTGLGLNLIETKYVTPERLTSNPHLPKLVNGFGLLINGVLHVYASTQGKAWWAEYVKRAALGGAIISSVRLFNDFMPEKNLAGLGEATGDQLVIVTDPGSFPRLPGNMPRLGAGNPIRESLGNPFGASADMSNPFRQAA
jgi:hypothetical protein